MYRIGIHSNNDPVYHDFETLHEAQSFFDSLPADHGQTLNSKVFEKNGDIFMAMWVDYNDSNVA